MITIRLTYHYGIKIKHTISISLTYTTKQVHPSLGTDIYPHMPILRPHTAITYSGAKK